MNQWRKDIAKWRCGRTLYLSVPFTWLLDDAKDLADDHNGPVVAGGPAVDLAQSDYPNTPEPVTWAETPGDCPFDTLAMHNPCATFTTRGCPNKCDFCAVPKIEGTLQILADWKPAPMVCDNNILAAGTKHFTRVIESMLQFPYCDFNQGLDARMFNQDHARQLARLQGVKVRFAWDHTRDQNVVHNAITTAREYGLRDFGVYVLIGFDDTPEDALHRLDTVRGWGIRPNPMRFQPLNATHKNTHVHEAWTDHELRRMMKYYSQLRHLEHVPYAEFRPTQPALFT